MFERLLEFGSCGPDAAGSDRGILIVDSGSRGDPCGAAALADVLLQELDQFVLVLDNVAAQVLKGARRRKRDILHESPAAESMKRTRAGQVYSHPLLSSSSVTPSPVSHCSAAAAPPPHVWWCVCSEITFSDKSRLVSVVVVVVAMRGHFNLNRSHLMMNEPHYLSL